MMYSRRDSHQDLCVLRVRTEVLGVVVTDQNASSGYARFYEANPGLAALNHDLVFAAWWTHSNYHEQLRRGSITCAEVLVPDRVPPGFIEGVYVSQQNTRDQLVSLQVPVAVDGRLFFR